LAAFESTDTVVRLRLRLLLLERIQANGHILSVSVPEFAHEVPVLIFVDIGQATEIVNTTRQHLRACQAFVSILLVWIVGRTHLLQSLTN